MPAPISTRGLLSQNCSRWHLSPLLAVLNCIATSQSPNPQVQVDACLHNMHVTAIHAEPELQPHDRLILVKAATKELARGQELWGAAMGEGVVVLGLGQQLVQSGTAKQPRCLLPQEEGDCGEGMEPAASHVSPCRMERSLGFSAHCPLPRQGLRGGGGHRKAEETSRSPSPSKATAEHVTLVQKKQAFH